jgi:hypothetical protein
MALVIETFLICDICSDTFGVDNRHLTGAQQRESAKEHDWLCGGRHDLCPKCRPVKKNGDFPRKHYRKNKKNTP